MDPAPLPPPDRDEPPGRDEPPQYEPEVGSFEQGTPASRWALARYLVGRAIGEYASRALLVAALVVLGLAVLVGWLGPTWLAVLIGLFALSLLLVRWVLSVMLRRLTGVGQFGTLEGRMRRLVAETRGDVRVELRRIGLPSRAWTMPLLVLRLARRSKRDATLQRLRRFDVERAVPRGRLDEVHLIVRQLHPPGT